MDDQSGETTGADGGLVGPGTPARAGYDPEAPMTVCPALLVTYEMKSFATAVSFARVASATGPEIATAPELAS